MSLPRFGSVKESIGGIYELVEAARQYWLTELDGRREMGASGAR